MRRYGMSLQKHIDKLANQHKALDKEIEKMESSGNFDDLALHELKKRKLQLKDAIARLKSQKEKADAITRSVGR